MRKKNDESARLEWSQFQRRGWFGNTALTDVHPRGFIHTQNKRIHLSRLRITAWLKAMTHGKNLWLLDRPPQYIAGHSSGFIKLIILIFGLLLHDENFLQHNQKGLPLFGHIYVPQKSMKTKSTSIACRSPLLLACQREIFAKSESKRICCKIRHYIYLSWMLLPVHRSLHTLRENLGLEDT